MEEIEILAQRLRARLADAQQTQKTFAQESGVSANTIRNVLKKKVHTVQQQTLGKLADALHITTADLLAPLAPDLPPTLRTLLELIQRMTPAEQRALITVLRGRDKKAPK